MAGVDSDGSARADGTDIPFAPAHELAHLIQRRAMSSEEIVTLYLSRIEQHNPSLHAVVTLDEEGARRRARAADAALSRGEVWGPLHGVPFTLEDCYATAGMRSTWGGAPRLAEYVPAEDSTIAARLKAAGGVLLGKTNGPTVWPDSVFPPTKNPWSLAHITGGSSAGPAAALAAGLTPLDVGLDTLASIQHPAHFCGVYGMRPTEHRVPLTGVFFLDPIRKFRVMSTAGPMARSVEDLRLALGLLSGPDGVDTEVPPSVWRAPAPLDPATLRVACSPTIRGDSHSGSSY
jgi:amidase